MAIQELTHVYAAQDASIVEKSLGLEEEELIRWRTFGESQLGRSLEDRNMEPASLGMAIRSPLLLLTGGRREIKIQLTFHPYSQLAANLTDILAMRPFAIKYSSAEEWVELAVDELPVPTLTFANSEQGSDIVLTLQIELSEKMPPLSASILEEENMSHEQPVLQLFLRELSITEDDVETYQSPYQYFQPLTLKSVSLEVLVNDLAPSHLQNKNGVLDPAKSFMPFGIQAKGGANFFIGHPEVSFKKLDGIDVNLHWMGIPDSNMGNYYANYTTSNLLNSSFTTKLQLFDNQSVITLSNAYPLFHPGDAFEAQTLHLGEPITFEDSTGSPNDERVNIEEIIQNVQGQEDYEYKVENNPVTGDKLQDWNRFIILKLDSPGFMHEIYPGRANQLAIQLAADIGKEDIKENSAYEINPPYSPELEKILINYKASTQFDFSQQTSDNKQEELLHLSPFGFGPLQKTLESEAYFMPQFLDEGTLYLAFADVQPPQNLSLLFQVAEGSANPDIPLTTLTWSYLSGDEWKNLEEGKIISDTTNGLINSGIVQISLPGDASSTHTVMPSGYHWIAIEAPDNAQSVCDLVEIHPQGVTALFKDKENAVDHLASPLPPETITKFKKAIPGIKKIQQPYSSFGGKMPEEDESFYTRVSERLRHKDRATNLWDYEHMVLGSFPQIYKVKCLPADIDSYPDEPGRVDVIVVPDIKGKLPFDPFEPKAPINLLQEIEGYLQEVSSPFAMIKVQNPSYIHLKVRFAVKFLPGKDIGFYLHQLNEDLKRFLAPWAYDDGAEIEFGGKVYTHAIVNFIDERDYVDYMAGMRIFTSTDGENFLPAAVNPADGGIQTQNPSAIWVSARSHEIDTITENTFEAQSFDGVGHMRIELDFQIE